MTPPPHPRGAPSECKAVYDACSAAGFKQGDFKNGDGLWRNCIGPIMQGNVAAAEASKTLPTVDAATIAACKAKHPRFGQGPLKNAKHPQ